MIELTEQERNLILSYLYTCPWKQVNDIIVMIQSKEVKEIKKNENT